MIIINKKVDENLIESCRSFSREKNRFWPSECSCSSCGKITGKCAREVYYNFMGEKSTNPISARGLRICDAGNMYEDKEIERVKNIKYYKDSARRFTFKIPGTELTVAGKLDIVYDIDNMIIGGEIKSGYGYTFKQQVFDTPTCPGLPVLKHLMQVMMYLYYYKHMEKELNINEFYITYIDRGDCEHTQFGIKLTEDNYPIIESESGNIIVARNITIDNPYLFNQNPKGKREQNKITKYYNKLKYYDINVDNIFNRFIYIADFIDKKTLPPKDFKYFYTQEELQYKYQNGEISKAKYDKINKYNLIERDFQCTYCDFLQKCVSDDKNIKFKE